MTRQNSRISRRAITFLELLFVIVIIGIFSTIAVSGFRKTFSRLQLNGSAGELQALAGFLSQRAVAERMPVYLKIDSQGSHLEAVRKDPEGVIKTFKLPPGLSVTSDSQTGEIAFYPDGSLDEATLTLKEESGEAVNLTTKGVLGGVKIQP
jgi:prepilin-type N-terminal cleavage/methylation domain-containing protein